MRNKKLQSRVLLLAMMWLWGGCQTASYYRQAISGQLQVLSDREKITKILRDPSLPAPLQRKLELVLDLREFARTNLDLPVDDQYACYVDLRRQYAVWNVHAAPEFSLRPKTWRYPIVGTLKYRGYFAESAARNYGRALATKGYDVYVHGVDAYSTLGWFKDPVLNTFIHQPETGLAEILFHELGHQRLFLRGDTDFNEAFATAVAEEGVRRWLESTTNASALAAYQVALQRNRQFVDLIMDTRRQLKELYGDPEDDDAKPPKQLTAPVVSALREPKAKIQADLRARYQRLKTAWGGYSGYDHWFGEDLNNAQLNTVASYYRLVPAFQRLLAANGNDLGAFYREVKLLSRKSKTEREKRLETLLSE